MRLPTLFEQNLGALGLRSQEGYQLYLFWQISRLQFYWFRFDKGHQLYFHLTKGQRTKKLYGWFHNPR